MSLLAVSRMSRLGGALGAVLAVASLTMPARPADADVSVWFGAGTPVGWAYAPRYYYAPPLYYYPARPYWRWRARRWCYWHPYRCGAWRWRHHRDWDWDDD